MMAVITMLFSITLINLSMIALSHAFISLPTSSLLSSTYHHLVSGKSHSTPATPRHKELNKRSSFAIMMSNNKNPATNTTPPSSKIETATLHQNDRGRAEARQMVSETLCPPNEERDRDIAGIEAYANTNNDGSGDAAAAGRGGRGVEVITNDDPRGEYTYGEFPFESFDMLVDRALDYVSLPRLGKDDDDTNDQRLMEEEEGYYASNHHRHRQYGTMVDLGSGCGRLVFYAALTRGGGGGETEKATATTTPAASCCWNVHGVEIGTQLHSLAINSLQRGIDRGWFESTDNDNDISEESVDDGSSSSSPTMAFHNGNALLVEDPYFTPPKSSNSNNNSSNRDSHKTPDEAEPYKPIQSLLANTNLLFAYSTVYETNKIQPFHPELGAMILAPKWSQTLSQLCQNGCVAVTTDRALDPKDGWRLVDRMEVENPSVWGSVGYISVLDK